MNNLYRINANITRIIRILVLWLMCVWIKLYIRPIFFSLNNHTYILNNVRTTYNIQHHHHDLFHPNPNPSIHHQKIHVCLNEMKNLIQASKSHGSSTLYSIKEDVSTKGNLNNFDVILFYINPKRWIAIIKALFDQTPHSNLILLRVIKSFILNHVLTLIILQMTLLYLPSSIKIVPAKRSIGPASRLSFIQQSFYSSYTQSQLQNLPQRCPRFNSISLLTLLSPFSLASFHEQIMSNVNVLISRFQMWKILRTEPDEEAIICLHKGIANQEIVRTKSFDIYFPPRRLLSTNVKPKVLLFLPGAFINHTSYANVSMKLAESGITVVVMSMEPLRLAVKGLGADLGDIKKTIKLVETKYIRQRYNNDNSVEWSLGGHSAGAYGAFRLAAEVENYLVNQIKSQDKLKLVIYAAGNIERYVPDLSSCDHKLEVLVVLGSNDAYCKFSPSAGVLLSSFLSKLPKLQDCIVIDGGTHNNFASYSGLVEYNGVQGISRTQQHHQVANATARFLMGESIMIE